MWKNWWYLRHDDVRMWGCKTIVLLAPLLSWKCGSAWPPTRGRITSITWKLKVGAIHDIMDLVWPWYDYISWYEHDVFEVCSCSNWLYPMLHDMSYVMPHVYVSKSQVRISKIDSHVFWICVVRATPCSSRTCMLDPAIYHSWQRLVYPSPFTNFGSYNVRGVNPIPAHRWGLGGLVQKGFKYVSGVHCNKL